MYQSCNLAIECDLCTIPGSLCFTHCLHGAKSQLCMYITSWGIYNAFLYKGPTSTMNTSHLTMGNAKRWWSDSGHWPWCRGGPVCPKDGGQSWRNGMMVVRYQLQDVRQFPGNNKFHQKRSPATAVLQTTSTNLLPTSPENAPNSTKKNI